MQILSGVLGVQLHHHIQSVQGVWGGLDSSTNHNKTCKFLILGFLRGFNGVSSVFFNAVNRRIGPFNAYIKTYYFVFFKASLVFRINKML